MENPHQPAHEPTEEPLAESAATDAHSTSRVAFGRAFDAVFDVEFDVVFDASFGVALESAFSPVAHDRGKPKYNEMSDAAALHRAAELQKKFVSASRRVAQCEAERMRALAEIQELELTRASHHSEVEIALRSRAAECAAAMKVSDRTVLAQMGEAHTLVYSFPSTLAAFECATITLQHVKVIVSEGGSLADDVRESYEARCLDVATTTSPGRLRAKARAIAQSLEPRTIDERHEIAAAERRVWVRELPDGMAELGAVIPAVLAYGIRDRIDRIAKAAKQHVARATSEARARAVQTTSENEPGFTPETSASAGANSTLDAYRADVFADLLLTGMFAGGTAETPTRSVIDGIQANISIVIPVGGTALLDGYGPIDSSIARQFAAAAPGWDTIFATAGGEVLATDRRQPTEAMKRILRTRDQHCRFPSCSAPTSLCEIDHTVEWSLGGQTEISNLGFLCPRHHALKHPDLAHQIKWRVKQDSKGKYIWTSPTGVKFIEQPEYESDTRSIKPRGAPAPEPQQNSNDDTPF